MRLISNSINKDTLLKDETLFHVANGYLGVRGNLEEGSADKESIRGCYINGFYDTVELSYPERLYGFPLYAERMINLPDIQNMQIFVNGCGLGDPVEYERLLDTSDGLTKRCLKYAVESGYITVTFTRMASFTRPELFLTVLDIKSDNVSGKLEIHSGINCNVENYTNPDDPRVAAESIKHFDLTEAVKLQDGGYVRCRTSGSKLEFAIVQRFKAENGNIESREHGEGITVKLAAGITSTVEKYTVFSDSRRQKDPAGFALKTADECIRAGVETLLSEQKIFLDEFWTAARVFIDGLPDVQDALEFNIYQLLQSTGRDGISSVAAKGISGEGYEGHYFWDEVIYIFPFFLFTKPEIAKAILDFRYSILDGARAHARVMGHDSGALYPWRTIAGSECSSYFPSGSAQYHINGDIAHAFMQYWYATGDLDYMSKKGAEVLIETARLWLDTGHYDSEGLFNIHTVTGPDEYTCIVNNNYYTNRCAQANLKGTAAIYRTLLQEGAAACVETATGITLEEAKQFEDAAAAMFLPYDKKRDINAQDDSFLNKPVLDLSRVPEERFPLLLNFHPLYLYRHQVCKQADTVMAHFLFEDGVAESTKRNSFDYYESVTTHDSSLSRCAFCIMAAQLGYSKKALDYFNDIIWTDIKDLHGNVKDGLHTANLGGSWLAVVMGFTGMRLNEKGLHFKFMKPEDWGGISYRINYLGRLLFIQVNSKKSSITLEKGKTLEVFVNGKQIHLDEGYIEVIQ